MANLTSLGPSDMVAFDIMAAGEPPVVGAESLRGAAPSGVVSRSVCNAHARTDMPVTGQHPNVPAIAENRRSPRTVGKASDGPQVSARGLCGQELLPESGLPMATMWSLMRWESNGFADRYR